MAVISAPYSNHFVITLLSTTLGFLFVSQLSLCSHWKKTTFTSLCDKYSKYCPTLAFYNTKQKLETWSSYSLMLSITQLDESNEKTDSQQDRNRLVLVTPLLTLTETKQKHHVCSSTAWARNVQFLFRNCHTLVKKV